MPTVIADVTSGWTLVLADDSSRAALYHAHRPYDNALLDATTHLWIRADGMLIPMRPVNDRDYQLAQLYQLVGTSGHRTGPIATTRPCVMGLLMIVHDNGWIEQPPMPYNAAASLLAQEAIAGDVLLCPDGSIW